MLSLSLVEVVDGPVVSFADVLLRLSSAEPSELGLVPLSRDVVPPVGVPSLAEPPELAPSSSETVGPHAIAARSNATKLSWIRIVSQGWYGNDATGPATSPVLLAQLGPEAR